MQLDEIVFRNAGLNDGDAIAALHAESWRSAYRGLVPDDFLGATLDAQRRQAWRERFTSPDPDRRFVLTATADGQLVGFTCVLADEEPAFGPLLDNLHVKPGLRGNGIGARLLHASREWVREIAPGQPMHLWVLTGNTAARGFYRAQGGVEGEERVNEMGGIPVTAVRYIWQAL